MTAKISSRASELMADRVPFVHAVVVRAQFPTSAKAGDDAIVLSDGSIEGFVGGQCAENSVRTAALDVLVNGRPLLLRVLPEGDVTFPESHGAQVVVNPCLSGGALEIFLEPNLPAPVVDIVGDTPVADALATIAEVLGYVPRRTGTISPGTAAVIVATHGRNEIETIRAALDADVGYIALVASRRRGSGVLDELALTSAERDRISTPAGLDIGARTAPEVALSILAEVITAVRRDPPRTAVNATTTSPPRQVIDPVCGMTVTVMADTPHLSIDGRDFWFCNPGCRERHAELAGSAG